MTESKPALDPKPWVSWGVRYATQLSKALYFEPGPEYSQNREDYPA